MSAANELVLPDSRLTSRNLGTFMADWENPDGTTVRVEVAPVYCANCGKLYGYVPKENTTFAFYLCHGCFKAYGAIAGTYTMPDDEFNRKLHEEMVARVGKDSTGKELDILAEQGNLGRSLELLIRESPYPVYRGDT